jgi:hypothetical protein
MTLSEEAAERLTDIVRLQPTKNSELQEAWGLDSGSEVHQYLESQLKSYYYRNDDNLICATPKAERRITGERFTGTRSVSGGPLERRVLDALPGPSAEPQSVVATLHAIREGGHDAAVDEVRSTLNRFVDVGIVERVKRAVPTFRLALERDQITVEGESDRAIESTPTE